jgi:deazaflavin-dependent oxidoreductase (nitroreductase family)
VATALYRPLAMSVAGTRLMPLYGVITHRGRKSGRVFQTPVAVRPTPEGFVIPMPWGESTDWCRNVQAAGGCSVRWKGRDYPLDRPQTVTIADTGQGFAGWQKAALQRFGLKLALFLRHQGQPA